MDGGLTATLSPALDHIIERPRLIALLDDADARVILLVAPAGYGKTTLARQWSAHQTGPVAWYRTTRTSGDVAALAVGLDSVLAAAAPDVPRNPRRIASIAAVNPRPAPLARALVSTYSGLTRDLLLVLDEYEAAGSGDADELVGALVAELNIRILVTSRANPSWFGPRLLVYGEAIEVGLEQLSMTDEEAHATLDADNGPLLAISRGWPAVLGLAAIRRTADVPGESALPTAIYDYLATELLDAAGTSVQRAVTLLTATSIGDMSAARLLLGDSAEGLIADAQRRGLVVQESAGRCSVHPLLRRVLLARLEVADSTEVARLIEQANVLWRHGLWTEALSLAEVLPDREFISTSLRAALVELLSKGRVATLRKWLELGRAADADPGLLDYVEAELELRHGATLRARGLGTRAAATLEGDLAARAHLVVARAAHLTDRPELTRRHTYEAERLATSQESREAAIWLRLLSAIEQERDDARSILLEHQATTSFGPALAARAAQGKMLLAQLEGGLGPTIEEGEVAVSAFRDETDALSRTSLLSVFAYCLVLAARYEEGLAAAQELTDLASECGLDFAVQYGLLHKAAALIGKRRFALADRALRAAERKACEELAPHVRGYIAMHRARLYASMGDIGRALDVLSLSADSGSSRPTRGEYLALRGLLMVASGLTSDGLKTVRASADVSRSLETRALADITHAVAALRRAPSAPAEAQAAFRNAVATEVLDAVILGLRIAPDLARLVAAHESDRGWLRTLLAGSSDAALAAQIGLPIAREARRTQALSPRELEIHGLIAQGMTNKEIARLLFISESTTKVHVRHILEKLGVRSRVDAARIWQCPDEPD
jgi:ATP/maltotriose-dependent transcriptional regulator MalT